jgi:hypothetical protein
MRRGALVAAALVVLAGPRRAEAGRGVDLYKFDPGGRVRAVRTVDVDGDGRRDVVAIVEVPRPGEAARTELVWLRTPEKPAPGTFWSPADVKRLSCDEPPWDTMGAVALRHVAGMPFRLDFLGPLRGAARTFTGANPYGEGTIPEPAGLPAVPVGRSPGTSLAFWDAVADLDGSGTDRVWLPGPGPRASVDEAGRGDTSLFSRRTRIETFVPADLDGDGKKELFGLDGQDLVAWRQGGKAPAFKVHLPFLEPDPKRPPEEIRTPRLVVADADGDGKADLLVTLVAGRADRLGGLRTSLYHYAGPLADPKTGALVEPRCRVDTESVALHPRFVDVDGDGRLDYVADSIRGTMFDLVKRIMGTDPTIWFSVYRFLPSTGTYEAAAWVDMERPYSGAQARGNTFGRSGFLDGDFDGDGAKDLLDLGGLKTVTILRGSKGGEPFQETLRAETPVPAGETLAPDATIADLNGDQVSDAVLWTEKSLLLVVSRADK